MIRKAIIILSVICTFAACQQDFLEQSGANSTSSVNEDLEKVTFTFSFQEQMKQDTEYTPMRAPSVQNSIRYSLAFRNYYKVMVAKEVDDHWVIEYLQNHKITQNQEYWNKIGIVDGSSFGLLEVALRPGKYRMVIFTGADLFQWNPALKVGTVIGHISDPSSDLPWAATYIISNGSYPSPPARELYIGEELFTGKVDFTIDKSDNVHSYPVARSYPIDMYRRVGRFFIALEDDPTSPNNYPVINSKHIFGRLRVADDSQYTLCPGLDVWGEPQYRDDLVLNRIYYKTVAAKYSNESPFNNKNYFVTKHSEALFAPHFFTEPGKPVKLVVDSIQVNHTQGWPDYIYGNIYSKDYYQVSNQWLEHNKVNGFALKPLAESHYFPEDGNTYQDLDLIYTDDNRTQILNSNVLFNPDITYNADVQ